MCARARFADLTDSLYRRKLAKREKNNKKKKKKNAYASVVVSLAKLCLRYVCVPSRIAFQWLRCTVTKARVAALNLEEGTKERKNERSGKSARQRDIERKKNRKVQPYGKRAVLPTPRDPSPFFNVDIQISVSSTPFFFLPRHRHDVARVLFLPPFRAVIYRYKRLRPRVPAALLPPPPTIPAPPTSSSFSSSLLIIGSHNRPSIRRFTLPL